MKRILRKYPEATLTILALVFLGAIFTYFSWGIGDMVGEIDRAMNATINVNSSVGFDLKGARALDLRGLAKPQP